MDILKLYLTSLEPDMDQTIYSQSIGGYISNSTIYPETNLTSVVGLYDTSLTLSVPVSGNWLEWQGVEYININNELMKVSSITNGNISIEQRGYNGIINMHIIEDIVKPSSSKELFNNVFNDSYKQYRCVAIKNISSIPDLFNPSKEGVVASNISIYFKQASRNEDSIIRMALEKPSSQYLLSRSTSWNTMQIIDSSLAGVYGDNYFKNAYLRVLNGEASGQGKVINSFDSSTGTLTLSSSFSSAFDFSNNIEYEILPAPSQRVKTGTVSPVLTGENIFSFSKPFESTPMRFTTFGSDIDISDLLPNDIMYVWFEREIKKGTEEFLNNDIVLNVKYGVN